MALGTLARTSCLLPLLLLLGHLTPGGNPGVSAQDYLRCAMVSVQIRRVNIWEVEMEFRRFQEALAATPRRECPYRSVCAQKLTAVQGQEATYSEGCWDPNDITEYTEVACYAHLCNYNLTFGEYPRLNRRFFSPGAGAIQCYNHGQLHNMADYRVVLRDADYQRRFSQPMPVTHWSNGMCGAAIYASNLKARVVHERVLTGDRAQKFAMLRVCQSGGCDRVIARSFMQEF